MNHRCSSTTEYRVEIDAYTISISYYDNIEMSIDFLGDRYCRPDYPTDCWDVKCEIVEPEYRTGAGSGLHKDGKFSTFHSWSIEYGGITGNFDHTRVTGSGETYTRGGTDNHIIDTFIFSFDLTK